MKKRHAAALALLLVLTILLGGSLGAPGFACAESTSTVLRVGYFAFEGYHNLDENGARSGYGYEYLQQMARYTGWTYEYVGYNGSWNDAQRMLESGEIDLLTSAQKTEAREEIFDFSEDPIGTSSTILTVKAGNNRYSIDNYASFSGIRVGMIEGNSRNDQFNEFAQEKGFSYVPVMLDGTDQLVSGLQAGEIDAIVTSSLRVTHNEWIVAEFGFSPYYVCVKKGNTALLNQVNSAIDQINSNNPGLQNELRDKYYGMDSGDTVAFTEQERRYITQMKASGEKLRVMLNPDRAPLSYYKDGRLCGIFGDVAQRVLEASGLPFEVIEPESREEYSRLRAAHAADLCMDMRLDFSVAEDEGYRITDSYYNATVSRVTRKDAGEVKSVAAIQNSDVAAKLETLYGDSEFVYYATGAECVEAVKSGRQDAAFLYTYVAEKALEADITHQLTATLVPDFTTDFCIGIGDMRDTLLFSIMNKCVAGLDRSWLDARTLAYTESSSGALTLREMFYAHPLAALTILAALLVLLAVIVILTMRTRAQKKDGERAKEIQRLFAYVCRANESVLEVNLVDHSACEYHLEENRLIMTRRPYRTEDNFGDFMLPEDYASVQEQLSMDKMSELIQQGDEYVFEARSRGADGGYHWYIYTLHGMVPDAAHPMSFMLFKRNVSELKEKEEAAQKALMDALRVAKEASQAKGSFMSRMSHEIRTPLNAVIGYLTLMQDVLNEPQKVGDYIGKCESAARHLLNIINDVLDISAIESGKIKIASDSFDLKELISTISLMFYNQAREKGVDFKVEIRDLTDETVIGDQLRLNQILMNLLSNAMKFTPAGGTIRLTVAQIESGEGELRFRFEVSDTGIGMSKAFMSRIFSPFEQEKAETARKYGGSGLGLSITSNLITMMRGSIQVESEEGKGTTFTVCLIFGRSESATRRSGPREFSSVRALIVDDESRSCDHMKALLKRCGVKSDTAPSGEAALKQIARREGTEYEYDLCLLDWNMPGIDGVETARRIRSECKRNMPIIIASAYDVNEIRDEAEAAGVTRLISKPLFQSTMFDLLVDSFGKYDPLAVSAKQAQATDFSGVHVLLAEDNAMNLEIAVSILKKSGLEIDTAVNGREALDKFTASAPGRYQVILMDVQMPVMDGYEATRAIRASAHPEAKTMPIIAMTANAFTEDVSEALANGMNGHIAKPINYDKLYKLLNRFVDGAERETE